MRGERAATRDTRHNKDYDNLKSSLKKGIKSKKHRVVFDESANEFFEADYIIVVRDECGFSDEGESEECSGCGSCERYSAEAEAGALSPPEGYKDLGLFNRDGTLREQAWWEAGDVVLVGERSGTVFTPQHLQLLRRLQRERMLRSAICADCDAHAALHQPLEMEYGYNEEEQEERELRPLGRRTGKHIAAGEERPRTNSSQQTTPIEELSPESPTNVLEETQTDNVSAPLTSEDSDTGETDGRQSSDSSPQRSRRGGILKGGRLWKSSLDLEGEQVDEQRSTTASDEEASIPRSVRFMDRSKEVADGASDSGKEAQWSDMEHTSKDAPHSHRLDASLVQTIHIPKTNSAVQQLFNSNRPPPPAIEPHLITSETLRAWDAGRPKSEEAAVRRVAERNALRCSLLRSEARKRQQPKQQETTSLAERIRLLTCDVEEEADDERSPASGSLDKLGDGPAQEKPDKTSDKAYPSLDKNCEKAFGSGSSSSSSSTLSAPAHIRQQLPDLGDVHQEPSKPPQPARRQFLSTLAPLTACVGSTASHEGFYYSAQDRSSASPATQVEVVEHSDAPAPDVLAGTPGATDSDDGLAAFARAAAPRTERLRQKYGQESQPVSSDDEHDDYGFHRRPAVRGIAVKQQLGASDEILQQMQNELQPSASSTTSAVPAHACQRSNYSWSYYSEANNSRPQSRSSTVSATWSKPSDYVSSRPCSTPTLHDGCYSRTPPPAYAQYARADAYRNCSLYANVGCSDSSQELYSSQTSSEQTSPARSPRCRRPESPPPIRNHRRLLYVPYSTHCHYAPEQHWQQSVPQTQDYSRAQAYYQQQSCAVNSPQPQPAQRAQYSHPLQIQAMCPAPARYRPVPMPQPGGGKQMICYSEKVAGPIYQPAPGSPSRAARGAPEGAPSSAQGAQTASPVAPPPNPVYYAMNV